MNNSLHSLPFAAQEPTAANANISEVVDPLDMDTAEMFIAAHFTEILNALKIDLNEPNSKDTPKRVAKMLVREVCRGRFVPPPDITVFPNTQQLDEMVCVGPLSLRSLCSHHFCPVLGSVWVGYIPDKELIGLSKFSRIVDWFATRPQMQEELVKQIADFIEDKIHPKGVAIVIEATHTCMTWRGVQECPEAKMATNVMRGVFRDKPEARAEFLAFARR